MRILVGAIIGFIVTRAANILIIIVMSADISLVTAVILQWICLFIGGTIAGYIAQRKGWVAGLLIGLVDVLIPLALGAYFARLLGISFQDIALLAFVVYAFVCIVVGAIAGGLGESAQRQNWLRRNSQE